jgi:hypothetical protein
VRRRAHPPRRCNGVYDAGSPPSRGRRWRVLRFARRASAATRIRRGAATVCTTLGPRLRGDDDGEHRGSRAVASATACIGGHAATVSNETGSPPSRGRRWRVLRFARRASTATRIGWRWLDFAQTLSRASPSSLSATRTAALSIVVPAQAGTQRRCLAFAKAGTQRRCLAFAQAAAQRRCLCSRTRASATSAAHLTP